MHRQGAKFQEKKAVIPQNQCHVRSISKNCRVCPASRTLIMRTEIKRMEHRSSVIRNVLLQKYDLAIPRNVIEALSHGKSLPSLPDLLDEPTFDEWLQSCRTDRGDEKFTKFLSHLEIQLAGDDRSVGNPPADQMSTIISLGKSEKWPPLVETCQNVLADYPNSTRALLGLCQGLLGVESDGNNAKKAHAAARKAATLRPCRNAWQACREAAKKTVPVNEALVTETCRGLCDASPDDLEAKYNYARSLGTTESAVKAFEALLVVAPDHERDAFKLAALRVRHRALPATGCCY